MRRFKPVLFVGIVLALSGIAVAASAHTPTNHVNLIGRADVIPNAFIQATFRFSPGDISVKHGSRVTWADKDETEEPHTVTIVKRSELPRTVEQVFNCAVCAQTLKKHEGPPRKTVINVGARGLDRPGDSYLMPDKATINPRISAQKGTTLYYLCAIHPWMQGAIQVR
jgi:plastocyanin